jgi:hypothetical protein
MKILTELIEKSEDTLDEIEWYAEKALHLKTEHRPLADTYVKIAEAHVTIFGMLHERMNGLIEESKKTVTPPKEMLSIWEYEHAKMVKEMAEAKFLIEEYKKSY